MKQHAYDFDSEFNDPAIWNSAIYSAHPCDDIEPLAEPVNELRAAAKSYLRTLLAVDAFVTESRDARLASDTVAVVFKLASVRRFTVDYIAKQISCSTAALARSIAKFKAMPGLIPMVAGRALRAITGHIE